jgi:hypothetical protein
MTGSSLFPNYFFNGAIDEASIYNRALKDSEIAAIFAAGLAGKALPGMADFEDRDADGLTNVIEYGLSTDVNTFSQPPQIVVHKNPDNTLQSSISILRDPLKTDAIITVERSDDLWDWAPIATSVNGAPFAGYAPVFGEIPGTAPRVITIFDPFAVPIGEGRGFLRIKVSR